MREPAPLYLHIGCGSQRLEGWVNVDLRDLPEVDVVADVTGGLPFAGAAAVFAEHFLEHLRLDHALAFLREAHRVLAPGGWLRLSTPNLDWAWKTHYDSAAATAELRQAMGLALNLAFHGWGHRFLWNRDLLADALLASGFTNLRWCRWGESEMELFRGLERHQPSKDTPEHPHVLIVEAQRGEPRPELWQAMRARLEEDFLAHLRSPRHWLDARRTQIVARLPVRGPLGFLLREHVVRPTQMAGTVTWYPEAPEATEIELTFPVEDLAVDEPADRRAHGHWRLPERVRRRLRLAFLAWLQPTVHATIGFRSTSVDRLTPGRYRLQGELTLRGVTRQVETEAAIAVADTELRAEGAITLRAGDFGLPPYRQVLGLLRGRDEVEVALELVAVASAPT